MKYLLLFIIASIFTAGAIAQSSDKTNPGKQQADSIIVVDASCGQCNFGMKGNDCELAIRLNGKTYFVDGTGIDDHGDAHASNGFCKKIRKAKVKGTLAADRFVASYFELLPVKKSN